MLGDFIEYVPFWVIFLSALALGLGTAVGYEKIVVTLGEKMGSAHMNPAQGTAAQASAIIGIGLANFGGMPVSTMHVLSAAVLGSVAGTRGEKVNIAYRGENRHDMGHDAARNRHRLVHSGCHLLPGTGLNDAGPFRCVGEVP